MTATPTTKKITSAERTPQITGKIPPSKNKRTQEPRETQTDDF